MSSANLERARAVLACRRIALVGASRSATAFSRSVLRELARRGYDVVPVTDGAAEVEGRRAFARVSDVAPSVEAVILVTPPARTAEAVRDCLAAGVRQVWIHRGAGAGSATPAALEACRAAGVEPVTDLCPFMVLPGTGWLHRAHAFFRRRAASAA